MSRHRAIVGARSKIEVWCLRSSLRPALGRRRCRPISGRGGSLICKLFQFCSCECHLKLASFILSFVLYDLICEFPICFEMVCCVVVFDESMIGRLHQTLNPKNAFESKKLWFPIKTLNPKLIYNRKT